MPNCRKCNSPTIWNQPYKKGDLPVNPNGTKHMCGGTLIQSLEVWKKKWDNTEKFKMPVWCHKCRKGYSYYAVCKHILNDGFVQGVDTCEFYGDSWKAVKRREILRAARKKEEKPNEYDPRVTKPL